MTGKQYIRILKYLSKFGWTEEEILDFLNYVFN